MKFKHKTLTALAPALLAAWGVTAATNSYAEEYAPPPSPTRISAIGYGAESTFEGYSDGQRMLTSIRASKMDAYRALSEQLYGVRINGQTTVSSMVAKNDNFRVYVDAFLRGAEIISINPIGSGNYETIIEIEIDNKFFTLANSYE
ncbi:MAG: LPP20 family lipoprotein [Thiotrichales bacterium]|jgi:hypothetical protein|nr:LPP20 family lipoprotein [Thiotrichales bacterium]MBT3613909.1 LPP20 family lipoprotein [Thiotrichales bacterium]MBT3752227.1 LPP20 family lipoprotein [Thiotrichales bacterium]MBT3837771.1 LPP20 family lipoprotein [Thiotrichales bacterium]MBT4151797.1 LPP20 family lipoprotein [Thiotrichales bacterium]